MRKLSEFQSKRGSVAEVMNVGICMIAMTVMMMAYFGSIQMMDKKAQIDQIARKYILRMETLGYLTEDDRLLFSRELQQVGAVELEFDGTTFEKTEYGSPITLEVRGKVNGTGLGKSRDLFGYFWENATYDFEVRRMSTAKN